MRKSDFKKGKFKKADFKKGNWAFIPQIVMAFIYKQGNIDSARTRTLFQCYNNLISGENKAVQPDFLNDTQWEWFTTEISKYNKVYG